MREVVAVKAEQVVEEVKAAAPRIRVQLPLQPGSKRQTTRSTHESTWTYAGWLPLPLLLSTKFPYLPISIFHSCTAHVFGTRCTDFDLLLQGTTLHLFWEQGRQTATTMACEQLSHSPTLPLFHSSTYCLRRIHNVYPHASCRNPGCASCDCCSSCGTLSSLLDEPAPGVCTGHAGAIASWSMCH